MLQKKKQSKHLKSCLVLSKMTLKEKYAYRAAMQEMADECMTMFNHYQDEVNRISAEIAEEITSHVRSGAKMILEKQLREKYSDLPLYVFTDEQGNKEYWTHEDLQAKRFDEDKMAWQGSCLNKMWVESQCEVVNV